MGIMQLILTLDKDYEYVFIRTFVEDMNQQIIDRCINTGFVKDGILNLEIVDAELNEQVICYKDEGDFLTVWVKSYWLDHDEECTVDDELAINYLKEMGLNVSRI